MGLFDKALKGILGKAEEAVEKVSKSEKVGSAFSEMKDVFSGVQEAFDKLDKMDEQLENETFEAYEEVPEGPSGFSWGPVMPAEPNQFNYPGTWKEYFLEVFADYVPHYEIVCSDTPRGAVFNFMDGGRKALLVEVMDEKSEANSIRRKCREEGTPYVRFYYNHEGWWNTREYVYVRVREALESNA